MASRIDPGLHREIARYGAKDLGACMSCGFCTATCPLSTETDAFPRRIIHLLQVGHRERLGELIEPWLCYYCGDCSDACPRNANPGEVMMAARRYLAGVYDWTGISKRVLRSPAWHIGALCVMAAATLALIVLYHVWYVELPFAGFVATPLALGHMFPRMTSYTVAIILIPLVIILSRVPRICRLAMRGAGAEHVPFSMYAAEIWTYMRHTATQARMGQCTDQNRWRGHWVLAFGVSLMVAIKLFALQWFQTDAIYPIYNPQRWLGYIGFACIVYGFADNWVKRQRVRKEKRLEDLIFPVLLLATAISGIAVHICRYAGAELVAHYFYAAHVVIATPLLLVELPFGEWSHAIYRPLAAYLAAVRQRYRQSEEALAAAQATEAD